MPVYNLLGGNFQYFASAGRLIAPIGVKFGVEKLTSMINLTPIGAGWVAGPQNYKFYKLLEYKRPAGAYSHAQFLRSFQALWTVTSRINCLIFVHTPKEFQSYWSS